MSESQHTQIMISADGSGIDGYAALVDVKTKGLDFYEEVSVGRAEKFVKCWNSHDAQEKKIDALLDACKAVRNLPSEQNIKFITAYLYVRGLVRAAIAQAEKEG